MNNSKYKMVVTAGNEDGSKKQIPLDSNNREDAYEEAKQIIIRGEVPNNALWLVKKDND